VKTGRERKGIGVERQKRIGVVLFSVGRAGFTGCGPAVFCRNLFLDPDIIRWGHSVFSAGHRWRNYIAKAIGSGERAYAMIGRRSPNWNSDRAATKSAGAALAPEVDAVRFGDALLEADDDEAVLR